MKDADAAVGIAEGFIPAITLTAENSYEYLQNPEVAKTLGRLPVRTVDADGVEFTADFLNAIKNNNRAGIILVEGRKESESPLVLEVQDENGSVVYSVEFPLEIVQVEQMFGHKSLRYLAQLDDPASDRYVEFTQINDDNYYRNGVRLDILTFLMIRCYSCQGNHGYITLALFITSCYVAMAVRIYFIPRLIAAVFVFLCRKGLSGTVIVFMHIA